MESFHAFPGRVGIGDVVVRQLFALNLRIAGDAPLSRIAVAIECRSLMRVFAVTQVLHFFELKGKALLVRRKVSVARESCDVVRDGSLVRGAVAERLCHQSEALALAQ